MTPDALQPGGRLAIITLHANRGELDVSAAAEEAAPGKGAVETVRSGRSSAPPATSRRRGGHLCTPDEVLAALPFEPTVMAKSWPLGVRAERYRRLPGNELSQPGESHLRVTLQMVHAGQVHFAWGGTTCEVAAGAYTSPLLTVTPVGMESRWDWTGACESFHLVLPRQLFAGAARDAGLDPRSLEFRPDSGTPAPTAARLMNALEAELVAGGPSGTLYVQHLSEALAALLIRTHGVQRSAPKPAAIRPLSTAAVADVEQYMREQLCETVTVRDLAAVVHCSPRHFTRVFRATVGVPPHRRLLQLRLEEAVRLLRGPQAVTATAAAAAVGFSHGSHLALAARRETGKSLDMLVGH